MQKSSRKTRALSPSRTLGRRSAATLYGEVLRLAGAQLTEMEF
jgi:hypothetical protein